MLANILTRHRETPLDDSTRKPGQHINFPVTAWTQIAGARNAASSEYRPAVQLLVTLYDRPLLSLFSQKLRGFAHGHAEDWKQDFVVSHLLSGKIFSNAKPGGRFRNYLAVAVRNYIASRVSVRKPPLPLDNASIAAPSTVADEDEELLSCERARDCNESAINQLQTWAKTSGDLEVIGVARDLKEEQIELKRQPRVGTPKWKVIEKYKELLRQAVREEVLVARGEHEQIVLGREITILFDALRRHSSRNPCK